MEFPTQEQVGNRLLPFYLTVDVSISMEGRKLAAANAIMPAVVDALSVNPILSDKVRFALVDFSDDARVRLPMCDLLDTGRDQLPTLTTRGTTSYSAAFRTLAAEIDSNVKQLKADHFVVHRPAVFFISDGEPTEPHQTWQSAFADLVGTAIYPNIIPFGVDGANPAILQRLIHPSTGKKQMKMYISDKGQDAADAITKCAEILISSVISTSQSLATGGSGMMLPSDSDLPPGISSYTADDRDFV